MSSQTINQSTMVRKFTVKRLLLVTVVSSMLILISIRLWSGSSNSNGIEIFEREIIVDPSYAAAINKRVTPIDRKIVLSYFDMQYADMAINFYQASIKPHRLKNFLFLAANQQSCVVLNRFTGDDSACFVYQSDLASAELSSCSSATLKQKCNIRTRMVVEALLLGVTVLHSHTDIHFFRNPFDHINCEDSDLAALVDNKDFSAGFVYARPTKHSINVYRTMLELSQTQSFPSPLDDQRQLTSTIIVFRALYPDFKFLPLSLKEFASSRLFFAQPNRVFAGDNPCQSCVVIHNNWIEGKGAKIYRVRELLLWNYDGPGDQRYYSSPTRKYLVYENPFIFSSFWETKRMERGALMSAFAIGEALNRTVILPKFHCVNEQKNFCSLGYPYNIGRVDTHFENLYREHVFLENPKVPKSLTKSNHSYAIWTEVLSRISNSNDISSNPNLPRNVTLLTPRGKLGGAKSSEIHQWFGAEKASILRFHSLYDAFGGFESAKEQADFDKKARHSFETRLTP